MPVPRPHPSRLDPAREDYEAVIEAHECAVEAGRSSYLDPMTGLVVITAATHVARGTCCESGCRHCPYVED